jgi:hypothetical protein
MVISTQKHKKMGQVIGTILPSDREVTKKKVIWYLPAKNSKQNRDWRFT